MDSTPTLQPTESVTDSPSFSPTMEATEAPSFLPTQVVTDSPSQNPTESPSQAPTLSPSAGETEAPSEAPTIAVSEAPTKSPTLSPTEPATDSPSNNPTLAPSASPTAAATDMPSLSPSEAPTYFPPLSTSHAPTMAPSQAPSIVPSQAPSIQPTRSPSIAPSLSPTTTSAPTITFAPSVVPTRAPSPAPTLAPTLQSHPVVVLTSYLTLQNLQGNISSSEQQAICNTQAKILNVSAEYVSFVGTTTEVPNLARMTILADTPSTLVAITDTSLPLVDYPQFQSDPQALYDSMVDTMKTALSTDVFLTTLIEQSALVGATTFLESNLTLNGSFPLTPTIVLPPTMSPTAAPGDSKDGLSDGEIAAIVICSIVFAAVCFALGWKALVTLRARSYTSHSTGMVVPRQSVMGTKMVVALEEGYLGGMEVMMPVTPTAAVDSQANAPTFYALEAAAAEAASGRVEKDLEERGGAAHDEDFFHAPAETDQDYPQTTFDATNDGLGAQSIYHADIQSDARSADMQLAQREDNEMHF